MLKICSSFADYYNYLLLSPHKSTIANYLQSYNHKNDKARNTFLQDNIELNSLISSHHLLIDVIKLNFSSITGVNKQAIIQTLSNKFNVQVIKKPVHKKVEIFLLNNKFKVVMRDYFIKTKTGGYCMGTMVRIFQPDKNIIQKIDSIFSGLYNISEIEYTLDLYSNKTKELYNVLSHTICQRKSGNTFSKTYKTTQYCCNIRKAQLRGLKLYLKDKSQTRPGYIPRVRIESTVKSSLFNKINVKDIVVASALSPSYIFNNLEFKIFNITKHLFLLTGKKTFKRQTSQSIKQYVMGNMKLCERKFFDALYGNKRCGGVVAVKKDPFFIKRKIDRTLDTHPIKHVIKDLIRNQSFV